MVTPGKHRMRNMTTIWRLMATMNQKGSRLVTLKRMAQSTKTRKHMMTRRSPFSKTQPK
jgi:hypothetical protein